MKKKFLGFLLIAGLALVAYASGAAARSVVGFVSNPAQTELQSPPSQNEDQALLEKLSQAGTEHLTPEAWTLTSRTEPVASAELNPLPVTILFNHRAGQPSVGKATPAWDCAESSETPSLFIAGVLVDGQTIRTEGTN
jgi:hypothetical protein